MKKVIYYTMSITLGLMVLLLFEGLITMGSAFKFECYTMFSWIVQAIAIVFTISLSAHVAGKE